MRDYEAEDPIGFWQGSYSDHYNEYLHYSTCVERIDKQISYAKTVQSDINDLLNDDSTVDDDLRALSNALDSALDDVGAAKSVGRLNSYDTDYINDAASKCASLISALETEKDELGAKVSQAESAYKYDLGRLEYYREAGY